MDANQKIWFVTGSNKDAPVRLLISKGAIPAVDAYYKARYAEFEKWQSVSADSDFE